MVKMYPQNLINFVSKSHKGQMGNAVREKPNKSKESAYNGSNFGEELESRSAPYGSVELSEC